jgi:predicted dehydrogenase
MDRRKFIEVGAAGLALSASRGFAADFSDHKVRRVALIGTGWYGKSDLFRLIQVSPVEVVALCDVDGQMLDDAVAMVATRQRSKKRPRAYRDYRKLLANEELDLVLVQTPDHWHALPMIDAVGRGLDVYVQKPLGVDIVEGQAMLAAARKYGSVVQVGMQRRSTPHLIDARNEIIKSGMLGKIAHVEIYCYYHMRARQNPPVTAPPANFDYEMWTGPAPLRPYTKLVHPRSWRAFMEYSNGIVGDMCVHMLDMVRWMLDLGWPISVSSSGGIQVDKASLANTTDTQNAVFDFGDLQVVWQHRSWGDPPDPKYPWGATIYGENGTLKASVNSFDFTPRGKGKAIHRDVTFELDQYPEDKTEKDLERHVAPAVRGHMVDFLNRIDDRGRPVSDIEEGHISTASCILANLAMQTGKTLKWDAKNGRVIGDDDVNQLLSRPYRAPWEHPDPSSV